MCDVPTTATAISVFCHGSGLGKGMVDDLRFSRPPASVMLSARRQHMAQSTAAQR